MPPLKQVSKKATTRRKLVGGVARHSKKSVSRPSQYLRVGMLKSAAVQKLRNSLGLTQPEFARMTGYSPKAVSNWESGHQLSGSAWQKITELQRLREGLAGVMDAEFVGEWLQGPNEGFGGQTPLQLIERGEVDRLWRMIYQLEAAVAE